MKVELTELENELVQHCIGLANIMCMKAEAEDLTAGQEEWIAEAACMAIKWITEYDENVMASLYEKIFGKISPEKAFIIENMRREFKEL